MIVDWAKGLLRYRGLALLEAATGIGLAVALLALLGLFIADSSGTMTYRAAAHVAPDWQIVLAPDADLANVVEEARATVPVSVSLAVGYADVRGLTAQTEGTTQTTGAAKVIGLDDTYFVKFPEQVRLLAGSLDGVLLAQQTAANLHASVGDTVSVARLADSPFDVRIDGIIDLPQADQLFQIVGAGPQVAPQAPPDNVVVMPRAKWEALFAGQTTAMPSNAFRQVHLSFDHSILPPDPVAALNLATGLANNMSAQLAGTGTIADNLAAKLDAVKPDALFATVLFLFLGAPGAAVGVILTMMIVLSGSDRRRKEVALLQIRGAPSGTILALIGCEALLLAGAGVLLGGLLCAICAKAVHLPGLQEGWRSYASAVLIGSVSAIAILFVPTILNLSRTAAVNAGDLRLAAGRTPLWRKAGVDLILLAVSALVFWIAWDSGYMIVTAPEGVPVASVDYKAYIAPAFLWIGAALLTMRVWSGVLRRYRGALAVLLAPVAGRLAPVVAAALGREHGRITKGIVLVALSFSFAVSTAIFNTTYEKQAAVDAALTNGADVAVSGTLTTPASQQVPWIRKLASVAWAEPLQHRFAYVGSDLQDLYGINPSTIDKAAPMSDAYFAGGSAREVLNQLKLMPNGVLVSEETVQDFQLKQGDRINLRLQSGSDHSYHAIPFTFVGVVREFPTAPSDSFLVANASYVAEQTGIPTAEVVLLRSNGDPASLAEALRLKLAPNSGLIVSAIGEAARRIGSSLVAVDLKFLTYVELAFALPLMAGACGLVLALGFSERRRTFATLVALGARYRHLAAFLWSEALLVYLGGLFAGAVLGAGLAWMLVKLMTHVFDPPPESLTVPWGYIGLLALTGLAATAIAVAWQMKRPNIPLSLAIRMP